MRRLLGALGLTIVFGCATEGQPHGRIDCATVAATTFVAEPLDDPAAGPIVFQADDAMGLCEQASESPALTIQLQRETRFRTYAETMLDSGERHQSSWQEVTLRGNMVLSLDVGFELSILVNPARPLQQTVPHGESTP